MLHPVPPLPPGSTERPGLAARIADGPGATMDLLLSVLECAEVGVVVADASGRAMYMNASARSMLDSPLGVMPPWLVAALPSLRAQVERDVQAVERVAHGDLTVRIRARGLARPGTILIELAIAQGSGSRQVAEQLARGLGLQITDARLLALLWRGLSNDEIAQTLGVRTGTIKSRLFRLYQKLGVKKRPAAVLRAQEVLAS
jgi:DNA-binding CsgD family transcriptional regulator